ncbi:hypothetical protein Syun_008332 [Stephania yunnanensis]|uniref:O-methyltransferase n=1 Tax=Stephania yunnanensis TaxID=152371 RepID=A0AAP0PMF6_9MAGN
MATEDHEESLQGQAEIWDCMFAFADSMALRCALELRIPDIIHSHNRPITLPEIIKHIPSPSPDPTCLSRIMRLLVRKRVFSATSPDAGQEVAYGLTRSSKWLVTRAELTLAPMALMETHPDLVAPWYRLSRCVEEGGAAFEKAHGMEIWEYASMHPEMNKMFNSGMECASKVLVRTLLEGYGEGFDRVGTVVDVGGGTGILIGEIVTAHPGLKGINFDLPHVVASAPDHPRVVNLAGDMFVEVPPADVVIMKWVMHDWNDEECTKILKNCRKAIPKKGGKVVIVDLVLRPEGNGLFDSMGVVFDLLMIAHSSGGKERTENEWKKLLEAGGFPRYNIIQIPTLASIIEAFPL